MDPVAAAHSRRHGRLPRTRGDGPGCRPTAVKGDGASPHTRGWTRRLGGERRQALGFPAHAGMDPRPARAPRPTARLPRTRGDGPVWQRMGEDKRLASPHTRGWTPGQSGRVEPGQGFPAHAGMDPSRGFWTTAAPGLPRTRGDGPAAVRNALTAFQASPHTRGWTRPGVAGHVRDRGFPAHAGMDPARSRSRRNARRLPRTRGDGPLTAPRGTLESAASPHTRGWT